MNITNVKIHNLADGGKVKAMASITIDGEFVVTGLKVMDGSNGLFVSMPSRKVGDAYKDTCFPLSKEVRQYIQDMVLNVYGVEPQPMYGDVDETDDLPF